jgi:hypothetical protein
VIGLSELLSARGCVPNAKRVKLVRHKDSHFDLEALRSAGSWPSSRRTHGRHRGGGSEASDPTGTPRASRGCVTVQIPDGQMESSGNTTSAASMRYPVAHSAEKSTGMARDLVLANHRGAGSGSVSTRIVIAARTDHRVAMRVQPTWEGAVPAPPDRRPTRLPHRRDSLPPPPWRGRVTAAKAAHPLNCYKVS